MCVFMCMVGYMCMWNCMCTMCEPVFGGLKFTCVFFDDSLLIEAGSLTLTELRARAYQFNYSDEPACPSFRIQGLGLQVTAKFVQPLHGFWGICILLLMLA